MITNPLSNHILRRQNLASARILKSLPNPMLWTKLIKILSMTLIIMKTIKIISVMVMDKKMIRLTENILRLIPKIMKKFLKGTIKL